MDGDLAFLPLGGTGEIGMNLNLYRCDGKWLAVDCGIGFGGAAHPEVDVMMPDPGFIADRRDQLVGLVITHAHEDHIGAVAWLWPQLRCPVYATPFAATVLRRKLAEVQLLNQVKLHVVPPGGAIDLHAVQAAIPARHALHPRGAGAGDRHAARHAAAHRRLEARSAAADRSAHRRGGIGRAGRARRAGDDLRFHQRHGGRPLRQRGGGAPEPHRADARAARPGRGDLLRRPTSRAWNRSRCAAHAAGRSVALVGRSLRNLDAAARECGYLRDLPPFLTEDDVDDVPDDNLLMLVTGSQGEPRSALARIAMDTHPRVALGEGDTVMFSSRVIPGNERAIGTVQDNLVRRGVNLMTDVDHLVHVSGHPARDELRRLYRLVKPRYRGADARRMAASVGACRAGAGGRRAADPAGGWRHPEPRAGHASRWSTARRSASWCWTAIA